MTVLVKTITPIRIWYEDLKYMFTWKNPLYTLKFAIIFSIMLIFINYSIIILCLVMVIFRGSILAALMKLRFKKMSFED